jgi:drug/metabolite transporter (DMT)-like permease
MDLDLDQLQKVAETGDTSSLFAGLSLATLFIGFVASVFGWFIFKHGRKNQNFGLIGIGIAMMVYPYFVTANAWLCFGIGAVLGYFAYKLWNR